MLRLMSHLQAQIHSHLRMHLSKGYNLSTASSPYLDHLYLLQWFLGWLETCCMHRKFFNSNSREHKCTVLPLHLHCACSFERLEFADSATG
ncbi:unnamed protein product [Protopolystoma xenopodis]|uniref:Uncharacterized protein n=1 Tax=Protopolystoma xenopodis TaxID=117903 RepID=A0A3S5ATI7_9PLAT|nr:unnamed protein product [Protopolystoma xenopodis]